MEDNRKEPISEEKVTQDDGCEVKIHFSPAEEKACYIDFKKRVIKLLYLIEDEQKTQKPIDLWFYGFVYELASANSLCNNKLTKVIIKIHGLYDESHYKTMTHQQIKRQIMECKGILEHLIDEISVDTKTTTKPIQK